MEKWQEYILIICALVALSLLGGLVIAICSGGAWLLLVIIQKYPALITASAAFAGVVYTLKKQGANLDKQINAQQKLATDNRKEDKKSDFSDKLLDLQELISFYDLSTKDRKVVVQMRKIFNHLLILQHSYAICNIETFKKFDDETIELETALSNLIDLKIKESKIKKSYSPDGVMSAADQKRRDDHIIENAEQKQKECEVLRGKFSNNFKNIFKELLSN